MDIFIDEAGDLGFSSKSSRFFVAAYAMPAEATATRSSLSKILKRMHKNRKYSGSELKFSDTNSDTRLWVLDQLMNLAWTTGTIIVDKKKVKPDLREKPNILYNYSIVHNVMSRALMLIEERDNIQIHIDKSLSVTNREAFDTYARSKARFLPRGAPNHRFLHKPGKITISHENSFSDPCIQLADYIAGSVFQKYERQNPEYYNIIEERITYLDYLW